MSLPADITLEALKQCYLELEQKLHWYEEQFRLSKHRLFGASSEHTSAEQAMFIFNEAEALAVPTAPEPTVETILVHRRKAKGHREAQLAGLPTETVVHELSDEERMCEHCGNQRHEIPGMEEIRREIKVIPAKVVVEIHVRKTYGCRTCEEQAAAPPIVTAPMPTPAFPGSLASPSAVAFIMNQKFVEGLPLYRQEQSLARLGINLSRQTMANWMLKGADWLLPLYDLMHEELLRRDILHADETTMQVIQEPGRAAQTKSYLWLYRSGRDGPTIVLYDYQQTRAREHPLEFLRGFTGYLHVDGYQAYEKLTGITLVGCWAHARRGFTDALIALPASARNASTPVAAQIGLDFCNRLFTIERELHDATTTERFIGRLRQSRPLLNAFHAWLTNQAATALPKSSFGKAVNYCLNQWEKLNVFLWDGRLELDNNRSERSIKPFAIGRKNWLFSYTPNGATASAIIMSFTETAKENGLVPAAYLTYLFEELPDCSTTDLDRLLPWSPSLPDACRMPISTTK